MSASTTGGALTPELWLLVVVMASRGSPSADDDLPDRSPCFDVAVGFSDALGIQPRDRLGHRRCDEPAIDKLGGARQQSLLADHVVVEQ